MTVGEENHAQNVDIVIALELAIMWPYFGLVFVNDLIFSVNFVFRKITFH